MSYCPVCRFGLIPILWWAQSSRICRTWSRLVEAYDHDRSADAPAGARGQMLALHAVSLDQSLFE